MIQYFTQDKKYFGVIALNFDKISETIYNLRKSNNLTQKELGDILGVSNRAVSKWESGLSAPGMETCVKICKLFHISIDRLFSDIHQKPIVETKKNPMASIRELYRIGRGPSSSHTIGPERASRLFKEKYPQADFFRIVLFGSLAQTRKGHGTE